MLEAECGDWMGLILREGIRERIQAWRFVICSPERLARPPIARLQLHYLYRSHRLATFYCLPLLSTFIVYFYVLLFLCVWGYGISVHQGSMTGIVSLCIRSLHPVRSRN